MSRLRYQADDDDWRKAASDHGLYTRQDSGIARSGSSAMRAPRIGLGFVVMSKWIWTSGWIPEDIDLWYRWAFGDRPLLGKQQNVGNTSQAQLDAFRAGGGDLNAFAPDPMGTVTTQGPMIPLKPYSFAQASLPQGTGFVIEQLTFYALRGLADVVIRRIK